MTGLEPVNPLTGWQILRESGTPVFIGLAEFSDDLRASYRDNLYSTSR